MLVIALLEEFTVKENVPKPAVAFQSPELGTALAVVAAAGAEPVLSGPVELLPHATATTANERIA
jgi:hypothetical protein